MGYRGLALGTSIAALFNATLLMVFLRRRLDGIEGGRVAASLVRIVDRVGGDGRRGARRRRGGCRVAAGRRAARARSSGCRRRSPRRSACSPPPRYVLRIREFREGVALVTRRFRRPSMKSGADASQGGRLSACIPPSCCWPARTSSSTATATSTRRCCRCSSRSCSCRWPRRARCRCASRWRTRSRSSAFGHLADRWRPRVLRHRRPARRRVASSRSSASPSTPWMLAWSWCSAASAAPRFIRRRPRSSIASAASARASRCRFTSPADRWAFRSGRWSLRRSPSDTACSGRRC